MQTNEEWMKRCLELASKAAEEDEVPVGALVILDGKIISEAWNTREKIHSVTGHAELSAIEEASKKLGSWRLVNCTLVTSLEPCVMCAGAIVQARVSNLIYGASDSKGGAQSLFGIFDSNRLNHKVNWTAGVLAEDCSRILKSFFERKRGALK